MKKKRKRSGNTGLEIHIGDIIIKKCREGITLTFEILTEDNVGVEYFYSSDSSGLFLDLGSGHTGVYLLC